MSKSVLVIDTPESCFGCNFCHCDIEDRKEYCEAREKRKKLDLSKLRPDWCPLMDLPEKDNGDYPANTFDAGFAEGRNQCIDEITGGMD